MVKNCRVLYDEKFLKSSPLATTLNTLTVHQFFCFWVNPYIMAMHGLQT